MGKPACFVTQIDLSLGPKLKSDLEGQGFSLTKPQYTVFQAKKKGISCTLYESGKLTVQGSEKEDFITFYLEPEIMGSFVYSHPEAHMDTSPHIGVDEAGKGDLFGPLCIASCYADEAGIKKLIEWGVADSKRIQDVPVKKLADKIADAFPHSIVRLYPSKYNELYSRFKNLNSLLAWGHATAIGELTEKTGERRVIIDQFANERVVENALRSKGIDVDLNQRFKGEEDVVVAAASILARAAFLRGLDKLSEEFEIKLPKGAANHVIGIGRQFASRHGDEALGKVLKLHFKTVDQIRSC